MTQDSEGFRLLSKSPPGTPQGTGTLIPTPSGALKVRGFADKEQQPSIRLSLVLPTFNEAVSLPTLLDHLHSVLQPVLGTHYELIVVDDDSPDRSWEVALTHPDPGNCVRVMRRREEKGLSTAVIRGWQIARGEILGVMDADLQHPPEVTLALIDQIGQGADLAVGSRHVDGGGVSDWSLRRRLLSRGAQLLGLLILPGVLSRLSDPMSGYFMIRRSAISGIVLAPIGYKILLEVVARARIRWIGEVGYIFRERIEGASKVTGRIYLQYLAHLLSLRCRTLPESRFFRFCAVGATGVCVDMSLLYVLSDPQMLGFGLTRSKLVAAEVAMLSNFLLNDAWTYREISTFAPGWVSKFRRFLGFNAICSAGLVLNVVALNLLFNYAGIDRYAANAMAIALVTAWNYWINRHLNWAPLRTQLPSSEGELSQQRERRNASE